MNFSADELKIKLDELGAAKCSIFSALCTERIINCYLLFAEKESLNGKRLLDIIESCYIQITNESVEFKLRDLIREVEEYIPDSDDYGDSLSDQAQCAVISLYYLLDFFESNNISSVVYSSQKVIEAVDSFVLWSQDLARKESKDLEIYELEWQESIISDLRSNNLTQGFIDQLRTKNMEHKVRPVLD